MQIIARDLIGREYTLDFSKEYECPSEIYRQVANAISIGIKSLILREIPKPVPFSPEKPFDLKSVDYLHAIQKLKKNGRK